MPKKVIPEEEPTKPDLKVQQVEYWKARALSAEARCELLRRELDDWRGRAIEAEHRLDQSSR